MREGGTTRATTTTTNTIKETIETEKATVKKVIENLGVNNAQRAALHAYYDVITRAGAKAHPVEAGGKTYRINPVMDVESGLERAAALKPLLDAGYKVESRVGNKVKLFKDIPWETEGGQLGRRALGELVDEPGYVTAAGIAQATREAAVVRYFRTIDRNPEFTLQGGKTQMITKGYTQMSDDKIRMGDLAGKWVRNDIAAEINDAIKIKGDAHEDRQPAHRSLEDRQGHQPGHHGPEHYVFRHHRGRRRRAIARPAERHAELQGHGPGFVA